MKELSIEEKAKAYDEAIERAKEINNEQRAQPFNIMTRVFPELKESEDERIRKAIIKHFKTGTEYVSFSGFSKDEIINWLEKQDKNNMGISEATKQKLEDNLNKALEKETPESWNEFLEKQGEQKFEQKFFINDKVVHKATGKIWTIHHYLKDTNSYYVEDNDGLLHHYRESELKLVEQKSAWSEEDENRINRLIAYFEDKESFTAEDDIVYANWLKSLKDRYTWKPSDEQIKAVKEAACYSSVFSEKTIDNLISLSKQLKKLMEE